MENNDTPTAYDWIDFTAPTKDWLSTLGKQQIDDVKEVMIEFALIHVKAVLSSVLEHLKENVDEYDEVGIMNCYPLSNIK